MNIELARSPILQMLLGLVALAIVVLVLHVVTRRYLLRAVHAVVRRTRTEWDEVLFQYRLPHRLSLIIPLLALRIGWRFIPGVPLPAVLFGERLISAMFVLVGALIIDAFLSAAHDIYLRLPLASTRPIKTYVQLTKVIVFLVAGIFIIARLADQTPWFFVSGLGAMMAIILLIFRDTLLSLVASIQLTNNDLIRVGDWIEMPQFNADGDVVDIALHTVRVRNWDKTITVVPTHKFLDHSFKNWRSMFEGGGRRIKRAIYINTGSIRFLTEAEMSRLSRFLHLRQYMADKAAEIQSFNAQFTDQPTAIVNARRLTNVGTFRAYIRNYLRQHPGINQDLTLLVRQLAPTPEGLPLEIYAFTRDTRWAFYEDAQADIFDHVLSIAREFGLTVYQRPSGRDLATLAITDEA